jgi:hypothetical protein
LTHFHDHHQHRFEQAAVDKVPMPGLLEYECGRMCRYSSNDIVVFCVTCLVQLGVRFVP